MYLKVAIRNVRKSYQQYFIYFATLFSAIALFYTFNSFGDQAVVLQLNEIQNTTVQILKQIMRILSVVIGIVCAFLVVYANNFLIKRRKKELGIYMLLGMENKTISRILMYETLVVGFASLICGLLAGFFLSQGMTRLTSFLLSADKKYGFVFSVSSLLQTVGCFSFIFLLVGLFNLVLIKRYSLIQLLKASRVNQVIKLKNARLSIILFSISLTLLGFIYYLGLVYSVKYIKVIVIFGALGTLLFFYAVAGFFLTFMLSNKKLYFRDLTIFITRQLNAKINETYLTITIVCLMLLVSIGALVTGFNLNGFIKEEVRKIGLFDYTIGYPTTKKADIKLKQLLAVDKRLLEAEYYTTTYLSTISLSDFAAFYTGNVSENRLFIDQEVSNKNFFSTISLSEINRLRHYQAEQPLTLNDNEAIIFNSNPVLVDTFKRMKDISLQFYGSRFKVILISELTFALSVEPFFGTFVVVKDKQIPDDIMGLRMWSIKSADSQATVLMKNELKAKIKAYNQRNPDNTLLQQKRGGVTYDALVLDSQSLATNISSLTIIITYISLYLGLIFLLCSVVILALQQLSEVTDNKERYASLSLLGVEQKLINRTLLQQLAIYFGLPLCLAGIHAYFGVKVVLNVFRTHWGMSNTLYPTLRGILIILVIYLFYFLLTYYWSKKLIHSDE